MTVSGVGEFRELRRVGEVDGSDRTARRSLVSLYLGDLSGGGAQRVMLDLAKGFAQRGVAVDLVVARMEGELTTENLDGVEVVDLAAKGVVRAIPRLCRYLRKRRPEALLVTLDHTSVSAVIARDLALTSVPVFIREANTVSRCQNESLRSRILSILMRVTYPRANGLIAVSEGVASDLEDFLKLNKARVRTIYNPVVTPQLASMAHLPSEHPWLDTEGVPVILAAGSLTRQKDFSMLIRAFARVRSVVDARLVILGEGPQREELERLALHLGVAEHIDLPGFVKNPFAFMSRAAVFALSSRWEGLPGVLVQAMACGCPVVSTDCPSGPDEILDNGRYGELVPVGDEERMAASLRQVLAAPPSADRCRLRSSLFDSEKRTDEYLDYLLRGKVPAPELRT